MPSLWLRFFGNFQSLPCKYRCHVKTKTPKISILFHWPLEYCIYMLAKKENYQLVSEKSICEFHFTKYSSTVIALSLVDNDHVQRNDTLIGPLSLLDCLHRFPTTILLLLFRYYILLLIYFCFQINRLKEVIRDIILNSDHKHVQTINKIMDERLSGTKRKVGFY